MARSLGTLTIDLVTKTGGFEQGMDRASRKAKSSADQIDAVFNKIRLSTLAVGAAGAGIAVAWARGIANAGKEISNLSTLAGTSVEQFQRLAYGARTVGIDQQKLADIFKDTQDKIGDFIQTGGGPLADFFENIAPKVGVTIEQFRQLSGSDALGLYVSSLEKANLSQSEMTFFLEAVASDSALLLPLLRNNGQAMGELASEADRLGIVMNSSTVAAAQELDRNLQRLDAVVRSVSITFGNQVLPVLSEFIGNAVDAATEVDGVKSATDALARDVALPDWIDTVGQGLAIVADVAVGLGKTLHTVTLSFQAVAADVRKALASIAQDQTGLSDIFAPEEAERRRAEYEAIVNERNDIVARANAALESLWNYDGDRFLQAWIDARNEVQQQTAQLTAGTPVQQLAPIPVRGSSSATKDQASELQALIKQLDLERITLGMTEAAAGRYRIEIAKGTEADRTRALTLYDQVQAWKEADRAIKQAAESARYIAAINRELEVFQQQQNIEIAGVGMGDRQREELEKELAIRQEYAERRRQLEEAQQVESTKLTEEQYQRRLAALDDAEKRQIEILLDAARRKRAAESSWLSGATRGLQNYADEVANVSQSVADAFGSAFKGMEDALVSFVTTGKMDFKSLADSIIQDMVRIVIQQSITGPLAGMVSGWFGSTSAPAGVTPGVDWTWNAKGGIYSSPSLSAYSGGVYDTPQLFAFADGAGVFGEAGPEAIMPLSRGPDGKLGVKADISSIQGGNQVNITVNVSDSGSSVTTQGDPSEFGKRLADSIRRTVQEELALSYRQGGVSWNARQGGF